MRGNTVALKGNIVRDADVRAGGNGRSCASFSVAWNKRTRDAQGNWRDEPHYIDCKAWMSDAQLRIVESRLKKGNPVFLEGHIEQERWEKDGRTRSRLVIVVDDPVSGMLAEERDRTTGTTLYDEDIPF